MSRIIATRESIQSVLSPTHVKGHQEDRRNNLTAMEKLNVRMDRLAKKTTGLKRALCKEKEEPMSGRMPT